jgi:hypothetical protein
MAIGGNRLRAENESVNKLHQIEVLIGQRLYHPSFRGVAQDQSIYDILPIDKKAGKGKRRFETKTEAQCRLVHFHTCSVLFVRDRTFALF